MRFGKNWGRLGMKSEWTYRPLGELVSFASGGTPSKKRDDYWGGTIPWISAKTLKTENIDTSDLFITEEGLKAGSKIAPKGSILLLTRGSGLFNGIPIARVEKDVAFNQDIKCLDSYGEVENEFIFYWLLSQKDYLMAKVGVTGIGAGKFDLDFLQKLMIPIPSERERKSIVGFASSISEKIRCNAKVNDNLEQQAQAIYSSMFIDNPDPAWSHGHLSDLITVKYGKDHKKLADGIYPVYGSGGIMRYVERPLYNKESVLIPRKGTLNNVMYVNQPFWSVDTMFYTEMKLPNVAKFVYHFVKAKDLASMNAGSAVPSMTTDILNAMEVVIPSASALEEFESLVAPMYEAMEANDVQSKALSQMRDTLLPKLMSGEIDVSAVQL